MRNCARFSNLPQLVSRMFGIIRRVITNDFKTRLNYAPKLLPVFKPSKSQYICTYMFVNIGHFIAKIPVSDSKIEQKVSSGRPYFTEYFSPILFCYEMIVSQTTKQRACLFLVDFEQLHSARAPHLATSTSSSDSLDMMEPIGAQSSSPTSFLIPPCCLTVRRARLNFATFAIVSAAKHFNSYREIFRYDTIRHLKTNKQFRLVAILHCRIRISIPIQIQIAKPNDYVVLSTTSRTSPNRI